MDLHEKTLAEDNNLIARGEVALWRAVITQVLMDAGSNSRKRPARFQKAQAVSWLSGLSKDFTIVCLFADYDPEYVKKKAREAIKRGCVWRVDAKRNKTIERIKLLKNKLNITRKISSVKKRSFG